MLFEGLARNAGACKQTDLILLDFSKAFNKINLSKLTWKLHQYGIRGNALSWIRAFLGNRLQMVVIEGEESESVPMSSGVPQSWDLPIPCIHKRPPRKAVFFADDTVVYLIIGSLDDSTVLQNGLDKLSLWEYKWEVELNPSKYQVVRMAIARKAINTVYTLGGQILEIVTRARYFG